MSYFRQINTAIWKDEDFMEFTLAEKLLFVYFFSNDSTTLSGVYKISKKVIQFETRLSMRSIDKALQKFEELEKIYYRDGVVFVVNFQKYNKAEGYKNDISKKNDIDSIEDGEIKALYMDYYHPEIGYRYPIDTLSLSKVKESKDKISKDKSRVGENSTTTPMDDLSELNVWIGVTGMIAYPSKARNEAPYAIKAIVSKHKDKAVEHCKPYYQEWLKRGYSKTNHGWLDWAVAEQIPPGKNGNSKFTDYDNPPQPSVEEIQKALKGE